jgi:lipoyl(octanoyl) transferase
MTPAATEGAERSLEVIDLGRLEYARALERQEREVEAVHRGAAEKLLLVEHPPVYTIGRGGDGTNLRGAPERLGVPLFRISRGGDATFHGPGQIVAYPILSLDREGRDLHRYLRRLEDVVIRALAVFGIAGGRIEGRTGLGVGEDRSIHRRPALGDLSRLF